MAAYNNRTKTCSFFIKGRRHSYPVPIVRVEYAISVFCDERRRFSSGENIRSRLPNLTLVIRPNGEGGLFRDVTSSRTSRTITAIITRRIYIGGRMYVSHFFYKRTRRRVDVIEFTLIFRRQQPKNSLPLLAVLDSSARRSLSSFRVRLRIHKTVRRCFFFPSFSFYCSLIPMNLEFVCFRCRCDFMADESVVSFFFSF